MDERSLGGDDPSRRPRLPPCSLKGAPGNVTAPRLREHPRRDDPSRLESVTRVGLALQENSQPGMAREAEIARLARLLVLRVQSDVLCGEVDVGPSEAQDLLLPPP